MNTVLDPTILIIPENDWDEEKNRDEFLEHLRDNLKNIDEYSITKIYWNDNFESYLWTSPPWRIERDWKNQLVPIIHKLLHKNKIELDLVNDWSSCIVSPSMNICHIDIINDSFLKLMHEIINKEEEIFLCVGIKNRLPNNRKYTFTCACHSNRLAPELIKKPDEWLNHIDLEDNHWPNTLEESETFLKAIEIVRKRDFNNKPFLYKFSFSKGFIRNIIGINENKKNILDSIVKRLVLTAEEAGRDGSLQNEYLTHQKQYRFRVTLGYRIQYIFSNDKEIAFLSCGKHDYGL